MLEWAFPLKTGAAFQVQLFNLSGDNNVPDFIGTSTLGLWTLEVYDTRKKKTGTLNSWSIKVDY